MRGDTKGKLDPAAYARFETALKARLETGARVYGDKSFDRTVDDILSELQDEAADLAGWGFVLWQRLDRLRAAVAALGGLIK